MNFIIEGGILFTGPLLVVLFIIIGLFVVGLKKNFEKIVRLLKELGLFSLAFGILGFILGWIGALQAIAMANDISSSVMASGLRVALIAPTMGLFNLVIARLLVIILIGKRKEEK